MRFQDPLSAEVLHNLPQKVVWYFKCRREFLDIGHVPLRLEGQIEDRLEGILAMATENEAHRGIYFGYFSLKLDFPPLNVKRKKSGCLSNHFWNFQNAFSINDYRVEKYGSLGNRFFRPSATLFHLTRVILLTAVNVPAVNRQKYTPLASLLPSSANEYFPAGNRPSAITATSLPRRS